MRMPMMKTVLLLLLALVPQRCVSFLPSIIGNDAVARRRRRIAFYPGEQQRRIDDVPSSLVSLSVSASSRSTQQQQQPQEEEEVIEFDEDEFLKDIEKKKDLLSYDDYLARMQHFAQTTSTDPTAVAQAHALFDEMLQAYLVTQDTGLWPNTDIYNLLMETHAYSSDPDGAKKVDEILSRMEDDDDDSVTNNSNTPQPNLESYAKLMEAWARRRDIQKVEAVVDRIITKNNNSHLQPDTYIYNKLIRAHGMVGQADEARRVLDDILLRGYLEENNNNNNKDDDNDKESSSSSLLLRPNAKTWTHVLRAYAAAAGNAQRKQQRARQQRQQKQQVDDDNNDEEHHYLETIQDLMRQMAQYARRNDEDVDWKPGVDAYNALLQCLSFYTQSRQQQLRRSSSSSSSEVVSASKEAESVLYDMIEQYRENGDESMKPTDESFFHVMNAYRGESNAGVAIKVEKLLELQRALVSTDDSSSRGGEAGGGRLEPSTRTCNAAIAAMSRTRDPQKAVRAQRLVQRMQSDDDNDNNNSSSNKQYDCKSNLTTYRNLLNTCAYSGAEANTSPEERLAAFQIAVETLNVIRQQYPHDEGQQNRQKSQPQQLDSGIYSLFLRACANLMPSNRKRDAVVESIFSKCCKDGLVNDAILRDFERTASEELQLKIFGGFLEDGVQPPKEWSRNTRPRPNNKQ